MRMAYITPGLVAAALIGLVSTASAQSFTTLHKFCSKPSCDDGASPLESPLIPDGAGNFFGTAQNFGTAGGGVLYELIGGMKFKVLYDFTGIVSPRGPLVRDTAGNFYGIEGNGASGHGGIFKLQPRNANLTKWTFSTIYTFCADGGACPDGDAPVELTYEGAASGAPYDGLAPLYGSTIFGGAFRSGSVFQLVPTASSWSETVLYSFCTVANCVDGQWPSYGLVSTSDGVLYGVTTAGGAGGQGVVFRVKPTKRATWKQSVVYSFCTQPDCTDGAQPAGLTIGSDGKLYGTATSGGDTNSGTLFRISGKRFKRLYSFCQQANCADGSGPLASPTIAPDGTIYGVTSLDPRVFSFVPRRSRYTVLHTFCTDRRCSDGFEPSSPLTIDGNGRLLGTTSFGGNKQSSGTVFVLTP